MTEYVLTPPERPSLPMAGGDARFAVRRLFCVGRNYAAHAREMGNDPDREPPFFFMKPADALLDDGLTMPYPPQTDDLHHEIELVVAIGTGGADITIGNAMKHVFGATVGLDMTRRDLQGAAKKLGRPWDLGKGFDASAPIAALRRIEEVASLATGRIWLDVNGERRQQGDLADQIWPVDALIAELSHSVRLAPGDLIMTGTPSGVAAVREGDVLEGGIEGIGTIRTPIGRPS